MRNYINDNIKDMEKYFKKRSKKLSNLNSKSISEEYRDWDDPSFDKKLIWTLPDLTRTERYKNFCRSIKKEIK